MNPQQAQALQNQLKKEYEAYQEANKEIQGMIQPRAHYQTQLHENQMVKEELDRVDDDEGVIYKLMGPVLVKQDVSEAKTNVNRRLELIGKELRRLDQRTKELHERQEKAGKRMMEIQTAFKKAQQQAVQAAMTRQAPKQQVTSS